MGLAEPVERLLGSVTTVAPWAHLARRFFGSLRPGGPSPADEAWVAGALAPTEAALWQRMSAPDRRHAVGVARAATAALGDDAVRSVRAAALLHDVGKIEAGFGPVRRAAVTVAAMVVGREAGAQWSGRRGLLGRAGAYLRHDEIGAALLTEACSDPLTVAWAREHHLPTDRWTVPADIGAALKAADDD
jgi:HD domain